jgi:AbrB family looped-hinge helix DNA binding protein
MKATGIVRRIDDLGRVVIPKEIRRTMRIKEGDPPKILPTECPGVRGRGVGCRRRDRGARGVSIYAE